MSSAGSSRTARTSRRYQRRWVATVRSRRRSGGIEPTVPRPAGRRRAHASPRPARLRPARAAPRRPGCRRPRDGRRPASPAASRAPSTVLRRLMSHSVSRIRIRGSAMERTSSRVSSSDRPTFTTTSSHTGRIDRMLASTGKSSLIAFLTMVNPEILTTRSFRSGMNGRENLTGWEQPEQAGRRAEQRPVELERPFHRAIETEGDPRGLPGGRPQPGREREVVEQPLDRAGPRLRLQRAGRGDRQSRGGPGRGCRPPPRRSPACPAPSPPAGPARSPRCAREAGRPPAAGTAAPPPA